MSAVRDPDAHWPSRVFQWVASRHRRRECRKALLNLSDAELQDIGVTRAEACRKVGKSFFWDC
jgi:uncharacterized protein YjiS (DUF1127 family)